MGYKKLSFKKRKQEKVISAIPELFVKTMKYALI